MFRVKNRGTHLTHTLLLLLLGLVAASCRGDIAGLCADRTAIEQVYYEHRLGNKPPFEKALSPSLIEKLVREDLRKEAALRHAYGVEITAAMLEVEVQRINSTTRAPEMLAEIKAALGNEPVRFAKAFAKPILVERLLREKFDNDDAIHAAQRREMETVRARLLVARSEGGSVTNLLALLKEGHANQVFEIAWHLGARPPETKDPGSPEALEIEKRFGSDAQILSSPHFEDGEQKHYFADVPAELQNVLRVQLRQAGDISAVIEMPRGFLLYLAQAKTPETLTVAMLSRPKRDYDKWIDEQSGNEL